MRAGEVQSGNAQEGHGVEENARSAMTAYVHGYSAREAQRLGDQADTLTDLLHGDTIYAAGSLVLEAGCGIGAQTRILARNSPQARFVSVDRAEESLRRAQA